MAPIHNYVREDFVTRIIIDYCIVFGNPAKTVRTGTIIGNNGQIKKKDNRV